MLSRTGLGQSRLKEAPPPLTESELRWFAAQLSRDSFGFDVVRALWQPAGWYAEQMGQRPHPPGQAARLRALVIERCRDSAANEREANRAAKIARFAGWCLAGYLLLCFGLLLWNMSPSKNSGQDIWQAIAAPVSRPQPKGEGAR